MRLTTRFDGQVARVTLNNPPVNVIDFDLIDELTEKLLEKRIPSDRVTEFLTLIAGLAEWIAVPDDANTYNLNSLITNGLTFNFPYSPIYEQRVNKGQADGVMPQ